MEVVIFLVFLIAIVTLMSSFKRIEQGSLGLVETLGKYAGTVDAGLHFLIPYVQTIRRVDIREQVVDVPEQQIITKDNVGVTVDGIVYIQINDPKSAIYNINNVYLAVVNLAQTNLRSVLGTMSLDETLSNREIINARLLESLDRETNAWWVKVTRVEIKRLDPPHDIQDSMSKQMKAEREKRASILESEGYKQALITRAEGEKQAKILQAESEKESQRLLAEGQAQAEVAIAEARATALQLESQAAQQYFSGQAVAKEQLSVMRDALSGGNTKYVLDTDFLGNLSKFFQK
jgi:regulator of protease activity HflC (stomatin/prohibitin superfamily)